MAKKENRHAELVSASANIEAPYELPEGWKWEKLGNLFSHTTGKALNKENTVGALKKYITTSNLYWNTFDFSDVREMYFTEDELEKCTATKGDLLICNGGDVGRAAIWNFDYDICIQNHISKLRKKSDSVSTEFFYYIFLFYKNLGLLSGKGIGIASLSAKTITNLIIPLPPTLTEQERIVNRIETMFAKLDQAQEKAQAVLDSFETRKAAILHKAFTGELTVNWRKENDVSDDSWEEKTLGEICSEIKIGPFGSLLHEDDYIENGIPLVNPKHIFNQAIKPDTKVSISNEKADELKSYRLLKNDIVLGRRGEMGRCAPVSENENGWLCGTGSMILRLKPEYQARIYSILISSHKSVLYFEENAVGTTLKNLNEKIVKNLPMPIISLPEQQEIVRILDTVLEKESRAKEAAQTVLDQIALLKKSILARAFRGKI